MIEARGRTGRKPTVAEKGGKGAEAARAKQKRLDRYDQPPSWKGAFRRALFAAVALFFLALLLVRNVGQAIVYFLFALVAYSPISYYTDLWLYRRRQRSKDKRARGREAPR